MSNDTKKNRTKKALAREKLNIELTVTVNFGDDYDTITMLEDKPIPFADAVVSLRNSSFGMFSGLILRAAARSPKVMGDIVPFGQLIKFARPKNPT